jgi:TetR/AcrR family transcriptional repressor of nem operon
MTAGRPLTYSTDQILDEAVLLLWENGYEATSLRELTDTMHLSKSSFCQGFGSKHDLFVKCVERYQRQTTSMLWDRLATAPSGHAFVADTLRWAIEEALGDANPRGCLIMNTATEFAQRDPQIASLVSDGLATYRTIFEAAVQRGQREGSIRADKSAHLLASYLVTTMSGLRTMVKGGTDLDSLSEMVTVAMDALEH